MTFCTKAGPQAAAANNHCIAMIFRSFHTCSLWQLQLHMMAVEHINSSYLSQRPHMMMMVCEGTLVHHIMMVCEGTVVPHIMMMVCEGTVVPHIMMVCEGTVQ